MEPNERRHQLLMAAKSVFCEKGYYAAGVADIVELAQVARGTFYLYFKSKREIFAALLDHLFQSLMERLHAVPLDEPELILRAIIDNLATIEEFFSEDAEQAQIIIREALFLDKESSRRVDEMRDALVDFLAGVLVRWQSAGILRPLDPRLVAHAFVGAARELFEQRMVKGRTEFKGEQTMQTLLDLVLFGLIDSRHFQLATDHLRQIGVEE